MCPERRTRTADAENLRAERIQIMPTEYYYDHRKYAMQNLESGKKLLNSSQFKNAEKNPDEKKKDLYA